jgi:hypothetical protein
MSYTFISTLLALIHGWLCVDMLNYAVFSLVFVYHIENL